MDKVFLSKLTVGCCQHLNSEEMMRVAAAGTVEMVPEGSKLLCEGETGDTLMILIDGGAEATVTTGKETHRVAELSTGSVLGEVGLLRDTPRTATVTTTAPTQYFALKRDHFLKLLDDPSTGAQKIVFALAQTLADRLSATNISLREALDQAKPAPELAAFKETLLQQWDY